MRNICFFYLAILIFFTACSSSTKMLEKGDYDGAIEKSIKKLLKDPSSNEDAVTLDKAYRLANERDLNRIKLLRSENKPENWETIYKTYVLLDNRQQKVKRVLPLNIGHKTVNYQMKDFTSEIVEAKENAADYFYENGNRLMNQEIKQSYREAYYNYIKAKEYGGSKYTDIEQKIDDALYYGTSRVLVDVVNNSIVRLPEEFYSNVLMLDNKNLDKNWVEYHFNAFGNEIQCDYMVNLVVQDIKISPEQYDRHEYVKERTVQDGFDYVLDPRGNVMKDSLGNDIKVPRYINLRCRVIEKRQHKSVHINGEVEIVSLNPERTLKREPVSSASIFEHVSARAKGDLDALDEETRRLVETESLPFPDDMSMIIDCSNSLNVALHDILYENRRLIK